MALTGKEVILDDAAFAMTKTDLDGVITSANEDFLRLTGYALSEVVGRNHNIVRHPDMPKEVYEDMWRTIKAGKQWAGLMINRCKNGDHYWAIGEVTPERRDNKIVGYACVRKKVSDDEKKQHAEIFRAIRNGNPDRVRFDGGRLTKDGSVRRFLMRLGFA